MTQNKVVKAFTLSREETLAAKLMSKVKNKPESEASEADSPLL
jgi:hypothetical protein